MKGRQNIHRSCSSNLLTHQHLRKLDELKYGQYRPGLGYSHPKKLDDCNMDNTVGLLVKVSQEESHNMCVVSVRKCYVSLAAFKFILNFINYDICYLELCVTTLVFY